MSTTIERNAARLKKAHQRYAENRGIKLTHLFQVLDGDSIASKTLGGHYLVTERIGFGVYEHRIS